MSTTTTIEPKNPLNEAVLLQAWSQQAEYDEKATRLKQTFISRRKVVLYLILISSCAAAYTAVVSEGAIFAVMFLLSLILPTLSSYIMQDALLFTGTTSWIKYRYVAEQMRMHIILYRASAGEYRGQAEKADNVLANNLKAAYNGMNWDNIIPVDGVERLKGKDAIVNGVKAKSGELDADDDRLSEITVENYVQWRLEHQQEWYVRKVKQDFGLMKEWIRRARGALLVGAIITALSIPISPVLGTQIIILVTIANAFAAFFSSYSELHLFGKTYVTFHIAANRLEHAKIEWMAMQNDDDMKTAEQQQSKASEFIAGIEALLAWERDEWYDMALQAQARSDQLILDDLTRLEKRANEAQGIDEMPQGSSPAA